MKPSINSILNHSFEYAKDLLEDTGQCYPFGAFVDKSGQVHPLEFEIEDKKNIPNNEAVINGLRKFCMTEMNENRIIAWGITCEADVMLEEGKPAIETISIDIHDNENSEIPVYYFPYERSEDGEILFGETFAVKR